MLDFLFLAVVLGFMFVCMIIIVEWVISGELDITGIPPLVMCLAIAVLVLGAFTSMMFMGQDALKVQGNDILTKNRGNIHRVGGVNDTFEPFDVTCSPGGCVILRQSRECRLLSQNVTLARKMLGEEGVRLKEAERLLGHCCLFDVLKRRAEDHGNFTVEWVDFGCNETNRKEFLRRVGCETDAT